MNGPENRNGISRSREHSLGEREDSSPSPSIARYTPGENHNGGEGGDGISRVRDTSGPQDLSDSVPGESQPAGSPEFSIDFSLLESWYQKSITDVELFKYSVDEFLRKEPAFDDIKSRFGVIRKMVNAYEQTRDYKKQLVAGEVKKSNAWMEMSTLLETAEGYRTFVANSRKALRERRENEFRTRIWEMGNDDKGLKHHEYLTLIGMSSSFGLTKDQAHELVVNYVEKIGWDLPAQPDFSPIRDLRSAPKAFSELAPAFLNDWISARRMVTEGSLVWIAKDRDLGAHVVQCSEEAVTEASKTPALLDMAIWQFLWKGLGYKFLHCGKDRGGPLVDAVEELVKHCDNNPERLTDIVQSSLLERWLRYAVGNRGLADAVTSVRSWSNSRSSAAEHLRDQAQGVLWVLGEKRLNIGGREFSSVSALIEGPFQDKLMSDLLKLVRKPGLFNYWVASVEPTVVERLEAGKISSLDDDACVWQVLHALGLNDLVLVGDRRVTDPKELAGLKAEEWAALGSAIADHRVRHWLSVVHGWDTDVIARIEKSANMSVDKAVQELLWESGETSLRLKSGKSFRDVASPADLVSALESSCRSAVEEAFDDGRVWTWLDKFHTYVAKGLASSLTGIKSRDLRLKLAMWHCGWKTMPTPPEYGESPKTIPELIALVDSNPDAGDWLIEQTQNKTLSWWLKTAQGNPAFAKDVEEVPRGEKRFVSELI